MTEAAHPPQNLGRFRPYPEYKDSGVAWLGDIPTTWEARRLKNAASLNDEALGDDTDAERPIDYVDIGSVAPGLGITKREQFVYETAPSRARRLVRDGDVIISTVRTYLRAIAAIKNPNPDLVVSTGFAVVRPGDELCGAYAAYALEAPYFVEEVVANSVGVSFPAINASDMACFAIALPRLPEQRAIAEFLDRETGKIDALVAKKERLIELLQEKRTALITHAVTKGLDPTAPTKPSGIPWLGNIPAHWEVRRVKSVASRIQTGTTPPTSQQQYYEDGDVPWFGPGSFSADLELREAARFLNEIAISDGSARLFKAGSTMVVTIGATIGKVGLAVADSSSNQQITAIEPDERGIRPSFLAWQVKRLELMLRGIAPSTTIPIVDQQVVGSLLVAVPPLAEQNEIVDHVNTRSGVLADLAESVLAAIDRLKEFRTALISAAVTGKIDVREEVA